WIVNANNPTPKADNPHALGRNRSAGYRARRAEALLAARTRHDADSMGAMQMDTLSLMARDLLPLLHRAKPQTDTGRAALALMAGWDGTMAADRPQPLIFMAWLTGLQKRLFGDELGPLYDAWRGLHPLSVRDALTTTRHWCDDTTTPARENCDSQIGGALDDAAHALTDRHGNDPAAWRWGAAHQARLDHPVLGRIPVIGYLFNRRVAVAGGAVTLNRGLMHMTSAEAPFASVHGAGFRAVYDLSNLDASRFVIATGQSGNMLSSHYDDFIARWRAGGFVRLGSAPPDARQLRLRPARR
ncbi:MAG: penicillin acylase family protein, partial [Alphaproteobacteria bacterium]